jgi:serine/threonine-protein kinase
MTVLVGRYRLGESIAHANLGQLWHCVDESTGAAVAAKTLRPDLLENPGFADRLKLGWAKEIAWIEHPGVVHLYDHGLDPEAGLFIIMEYVPGRSLRQMLHDDGRLAPARALDLVARIADLLQAVHERGLGHRELRPGKVLVRPDASVMLSLFGLSRAVAGNFWWAAGEPGYLSPEQVSGQGATYESDIFSLGMIAYECLAGRPAFEGDNPLEVALRVVRDEPAPLPADLPDDVRALVDRAIEKNPASRWPTAAAFAENARAVNAEL